MSHEPVGKSLKSSEPRQDPLGRPLGAGRPERPRNGRADDPPRQDQTVQALKGPLDGWTAQLVAWVAGGCTEEGWASLLERASEPGCPPWLDRDFVSLDDLSHRILAVALAFLVHQQAPLDESPFKGDAVLTGESLLARLSLPAPGGVYRVSECLAGDRPLRHRGWLELDHEWSARRSRRGPEALSVARFLKMEISLSLSMLGALLGLPDPEPEDGVPALEDLTLPEEAWHEIAALLGETRPGSTARAIYLKGPAQSGRRTLARALAGAAGRKLKAPGPSGGVFPGACLLVEVSRTFDDDDWARVRRHSGWVFLLADGQEEALKLQRCADLVLDLDAFDADARLRFWTDQLGKAGSRFSGCEPREFAGLGAPVGRVLEALREVSEEAERKHLDPAATKARLLEAVRGRELAPDPEYALGDPFDDPLVEEITPRRTRGDLCLGTEASDRFARIVSAIRGRGALLGRWNLDPALIGQAQGIVLFHGPSGTGKSMAAEVLAQELSLPLLRAEASSLEDHLMGETEKRVRRFFKQAGCTPSVLLLDEADSFLGDRGRLEGQSRPYYISMINCWLRELERFTGILVLTTNQATDLDPAIERRIQFRVAFEAPGPEVRERIWKSFFDRAPIPGKEGLDLREVAARYDLSGGRIRNAFLDACYRAAECDSIHQAILVDACEEEARSSIRVREGRTIRGFARPLGGGR